MTADPSTKTAGTNASTRKGTHVTSIVGFLVFLELASGFMQGYYLPLYKSIAEHLHVSDADITWFNTSLTLAAAICVPILSKLGDIFGHRKVLRGAVISVLIGSLITALAPSLLVVCIGRVLCGPMAVWLPLEIGIVHSKLPGNSARRGIGLLVSALTFGAVLGAIIGGFMGKLNITTALLLPAVLVAICTIIVFTLIPESDHRTNSAIDWVGFGLLALGMLVLLVGLRTAQSGGFAQPVTIILLIAAIALLVVFVRVERKVEAPAVNIDLVSSRSLWPIYATTFLFGMSLLGTQTILTTFLAADPVTMGYGFALPSSKIGLVAVVFAAVSALSAAIFPAIAKRIGMRGTLITGVAISALANIILFAGGWKSLGAVIGIQALIGLGGGLLLGALPALIAELSPKTETGIATGLYNTLKTLGGAVAGATFAVILSAFTANGAKASSVSGYQAIWMVCAAGFVIALVLLATIRPKTDPEPLDDDELAEIEALAN